MAKEIERKFLMDLTHWPRDTEGTPYRQGYLSVTEKGISGFESKEILQH